jgi:hypothetical protein
MATGPARGGVGELRGGLEKTRPETCVIERRNLGLLGPSRSE